MINRRPDVAVPALVAYLEFQKQANGNGERSAAIQSLGQFGTNASAAAPILVSLLKDSDPSIRQIATNWLPYIDRAAAERAKLRIP
jgi:HEAT repeat protein